jgi:hypothetical protein
VNLRGARGYNGRMNGTDFFQCDRCHVDCRVDSEARSQTLRRLLSTIARRAEVYPFSARSLSSKNDGAVYGWMCGVGSTQPRQRT